MDTRHSLEVCCRVPIGIEEHEAGGADEVEAQATGFGGEEEGEALRGGGAVERVHQVLAFGGGSGAVEAEVGVGEGGE